MSKKDFSVALKYVEARPRSQRHKGAEARVSGISVGGSGVSATDLSLLNTNLISVTNNFTALKDLFDSMFEKDSDGNIHAKLSLWSSGGITAGGAGNGGTSGGGASYDRLDSWADYSADKSGWVLSALLGNDLNTRLISVENAGYVTASALAPYALRSEIPSLVGYATQSWVESKNYLTGITSSMVTTALGYTPYNSANFTKANIKSTLGISDWALASAKPTYTASEVGALGVNGTAQSALKMTPEYLTDLNSATPWRFFDMNTGYGSADGNKPNIAWVSGITGTVAGSSNYRWQLAATTGNARPYFRQESNGNWSNWGTLAFTSDIPTKLSQLTDDVVVGKYLSLAGGTVKGAITASSFIGNLTGNANSATTATNANALGGKSLGYFMTFENFTNYVAARFQKSELAQIAADTFIEFWGGSGWFNSVWGTVKAQGGFIGNLTGNADSATKLATPRTIWGQSFDGTGNITGALTSSSIIKASSFFSTSISIECGANGVVDPITYGGEINRFSSNLYLQNRSGDIYLSHASGTTYIRGKLKGVGATFTDTLTAPSITIGGVTLTYDSVNEALCINGNMYALGGITAGGAGISAYTSLEARVARLEQQLNIS